MDNSILTTIRQRRSYRKYTEQPLTQAQIETLLEAATEAPNGMNLKLWHFTAVANKEKLQQLNQAIRKAFSEQNDPRLKERGENENYCCYYHAPLLIIPSNDPSYPWAAQDCACALQNIFLTATSMGLGSCWINQLSQTCNHPLVREELTRLGVPQNHTVYGCAAIGYIDATATLKEKKRPENLYHIIE